MAFDQATRNRLQRFVSDARKVLTEEFTRQLQNEYGLDPISGNVSPIDSLSRLDDSRRETARILRDTLAHYLATSPSGGAREALDRIVREQAFTVLNRLAAIRMAEARDLLIESLASGYKSKGFQLYARLAAAGLGETGDAYRSYLFSLFDELGLDLKVLFDRFSHFGRLFPREAALLELLGLINDAEIAPLWAEDETIGWIYQYFNSKEERKKMRDESAAPRNSRELAVRNQFFTPRYVVEFLTDNTLGRIWYEMARGETQLVDQCRYLVRRPSEIFLGDPIQAYSAIFGTSEEKQESLPQVIETAYRGELSALPDDGPMSRWISLAIPPDQFPKIMNEAYHSQSDNRLTRLIHDVISGHPNEDDESLLMMWAALCDFTLNDGGGAYSIEPWKKLWAKFVEVAQRPAPENLSQEELLKQPVYIPYRPMKDPREIRILDPACGSMHFGLYAFDLLEKIYEEAWNIEYKKGADVFSRSSEMKPLHESYSDKQAFLRDVPRLIVEHNIHGIDIDPRAVQIAGLSLWLRAQRAWQQQGVKPKQRPQIRRSNVVRAEPMPGEESLLNEFIEKHFSATAEDHLLGQLVRRVFEEMKLAGEAGSLLKIEEEIAAAVNEAKQKWIERPKGEQANLFPELAKPEQQRFGFEISGITDEKFWQEAEGRIYVALKAYAEEVEEGGYQRRLFAEDAAQGFALIDICRKRYDVVLMNPPFGSPSEAFAEAKELYSNSGRDIYAMFVERMHLLRSEGGLIGAILPRTGLFIGTMVDLRNEYYIKRTPLSLLVDLGKDVLDGATIRTACYVFKQKGDDQLVCIRIGNINDRELKLRMLLDKCRIGAQDEDIFVRPLDYFSILPSSAIAYWIPESLAQRLSTLGKLNSIADIRQGIATGNNFRFLRLLCELRARHSGFSFYSKGGEPVSFISDESLYVRSAHACHEMKANAAQEYGSASRTIKNEDTFGLPGITYSQVNDASLKFRIHPPDSIYDMKGPVLFPRDRISTMALLGFLNSSAVEDFMRMMTDGRQWHVSALKLVPIPRLDDQWVKDMSSLTAAATRIRQIDSSYDETGPFFHFGRELQKQVGDVTALGQVEDRIDEAVWTAYGASEAEVLLFRRQRYLFLERNFSRPQEGTASDLLVSLALGMVFGRWDIRFATGEKIAPELPDPFAPLPVCPPGMLQNDQGLPVEPKDVPDTYSLRISWPGILVDDQGHPEDIESRLQEAMHVIWKDRANAIEQEACEILGVRMLREFFRKPAAFFADHLKRYSKSRRQAPIYWPLSTASGAYTLWLYYHRLNDQTLYSCVNDFVGPKLRDTSETLNKLRTSANRSRAEEKEFERLQDLELELQELRDELLRLAKLPWRPNLNDGVQITAAPLWKLFRLPKWQKTLKETWVALEKGDYDWAHLAMPIWPERVVPKCAKDRSLAIAHGLEDLFWVEDGDRWRVLNAPDSEIAEQKRRQRSDARDRVKTLLAALAEGDAAAINADEVLRHLAEGDWDDHEAALLLYPQRVAEKCFADPTLARRLDLQLPKQRTKAARERFVKSITAKGCADLAHQLESALVPRSEPFAKFWAEIAAGNHDELAIALSLWPDRVIDKSALDVTLAEHHQVRPFFWVQHSSEAWRRREDPKIEVTNEIARQRSASIGKSA